MLLEGMKKIATTNHLGNLSNNETKYKFGGVTLTFMKETLHQTEKKKLK